MTMQALPRRRPAALLALLIAFAALLLLTPAQPAQAQSAPTTATLAMTMPGDTTYISEGIGEITFTITLDSAATTALSFTLLGQTEQTAQQGSDYTPTISTISIAVGATSGTATFTILDDDDVEGDETFLVRGSEVGALTSNTITVTIKDNDEPALWSGNLAVKDLGSSAFGCDNSNTTAANRCSTAATLSDNDFSLGGTDYTVAQVKVSGGNLVLRLGSNVPDVLKGYTLHVGTAAYPVGEATISSATATWSSAPSWTASTGTVALRLQPTPPLWEATLSAQGTVVLGCSNTSAGQECSDTSILTDDDFAYGGVTYAVPTISAFTTGGTYIQFDKDVSTVLDKLSYCVGGSSLAFSSAAHATGNTWAEWGSTNQSWAAGNEVYLSIAYSCAYASDTTLSGLTAGAAAGATGTYADFTLTPAFAPATTAYAGQAGHGGSHVKLTGTASRTSATVRMGLTGSLEATTSGEPGPAIALDAGDNAIQVEITAIDGTTRTYTVTVTRSETVSLSAAPNPVTEGSPVTVTATLSAALSSNVSIPVTLSAGTADSGDYGTLTAIAISAGQTSGMGTVTTSQDTDTDDETFTVALGTPLPSSVAAGAMNSVTVTIADDDTGAAQGVAQTVYWQTQHQIDVDGQLSGCDDNNANLDNCDTSPALADNDFVFEGTTYTVEAFYLQRDTDTLRVVLDKTFPQNLRNGLAVFYRGTGYRVEAADYYTVSSTDDAFAVTDITYDPSDNQGIQVGLGLPAVLGGITLTAGGSTLTLTPAFNHATHLYTTTETVAASTVTVAPTWSAHSNLLDATSVSVGSQAASSTSPPQLDAVAHGATRDVTLEATGDTWVWVQFSDGVDVSPDLYRITVSKALAAPGSLSVSGIERGLSLSWTAAASATGYRVDYRPTGGSWTTSRRDGTGLTHSITGLTNGVSYDVRVRASNAQGHSPWAEASGAAGLLLPKHVRFSSSSYTVAESDQQLVVSLETAAAPEDFTVNVRHYDGSAKAGSDFTGRPWQLHFQQGDTAANIVIPITADDDGEGNEYFTLGIAASPGTPEYYLARPSSATVTITDKPVHSHPYKLDLTPGGHDKWGNAEIDASWRRQSWATGYYLQYWEVGRDLHDNWASRWHVQVGGSATSATLPAAWPSEGANAQMVGPRMKNGTEYWVRMGAIRSNGSTQWAQAVKAIAGAPVPGLTSVVSGADGGLPTLTVSWRRDGRFDAYGGYGDDVIQIIVMPDVMTPDQKDKNGNDYWPERATTHSLPAGVVQVGGITDAGGLKSVTFRGFVPGEQYLVRMHSLIDGEPAGIDSGGFTRATMWSAPGAPQGLRVTGGEEQLRATWWPPRQPYAGYAPIDSQEVQYKLRTAPNTAATTAGDPATGWVMYWTNNVARCARITDRWEDGVRHPVPDGVYDVRARVTNDLGSGPWATTFAATLAGEETDACGDAGGRPNHSPQFSEGASATRALPEEVVRGQGVGAPVEASDPDGDRITYRLRGPDAKSFAIDPRSGQMRTSVSFQGAGAQASYTIIVAASDGRHASGRGDNAGDDARIEIIITDASAPPEQEQQQIQEEEQEEAQPAEPPTPGQIEPFNIRVTPGDGSLTVTWSVAPRQGVADDQIRHALRWSQTPGVWNNPRDPLNVGPNDGVIVAGGVNTYTITGLTNGVVTGVHVRSYTGEDHTETAAGSSKWVKVKGTETTPVAPPQPKTYSITATATASEGGSAELTVTLSENAPAGGVAFTVAAGYQSGTGKAEAADVGSVPQAVTVAEGDLTASLAVPLATDALTEGDETFTVALTPPAGWAEASLGGGTATVTITDVPPEPEEQQQETETAEVPGPVGNLSLALGLDGVTVTWEAPESGGAPTGYIVRLVPAEGKARVKEPTAAKTSVAFGNLEAGATYTVKVRARNEAGKGEAAEASLAVPDLPGAVADLQVSLTEDGATVAWEAPQSGGTPVRYIVRLIPAGGKARVKQPDAAKTSVSFGNLEAGATYAVKVRAQNTGGKGEAVEVSVTMPELPGTAGNLSLLATTDSITATWEAPQSGGTPTGYLLNLKNTGNNEDEYRSVGADVTTATFSGLEAGASYRVWVRAVNVSGKGERVRETVTLPAPEPEQQEEAEPQQEDTARTYSITAKTAEGTDSTETITLNEGTGDALTVTLASSAEGGDATLTVTLSEAAPAGGVAFTVTAGYDGDATATAEDVGSITSPVTVLEGNTTLDVTVPTASDDVDEEDETFIVVVAATTEGWAKEGDGKDTAAVTIVDDDTAGVTVSQTTLTVSEDGSGAYTVVLDSKPTADVTVTASSSDDGAAGVSPTSHTFTPENWNVAQTFTVSGVADGDRFRESVTISHDVTSADGKYGGLAVDDVAVSVTDPTPAPPEPEDPENAWRPYDANENGCIDPDEYMKAAQDYADGKIGYTTVLSVVRNRCE